MSKQLNFKYNTYTAHFNCRLDSTPRGRGGASRSSGKNSFGSSLGNRDKYHSRRVETPGGAFLPKKRRFRGRGFAKRMAGMSGSNRPRGSPQNGDLETESGLRNA